MLAEITDDGFFFQAINRTGVTVDAGSLRPSYCGHDGPSVTWSTLSLNTRTHSAIGVECLADHPGRLIEARAAEQIVDLLV